MSDYLKRRDYGREETDRSVQGCRWVQKCTGDYLHQCKGHK